MSAFSRIFVSNLFSFRVTMSRSEIVRHNDATEFLDFSYATLLGSVALQQKSLVLIVLAISVGLRALPGCVALQQKSPVRIVLVISVGMQSHGVVIGVMEGMHHFAGPKLWLT